MSLKYKEQTEFLKLVYIYSLQDRAVIQRAQAEGNKEVIKDYLNSVSRDIQRMIKGLEEE